MKLLHFFNSIFCFLLIAFFVCSCNKSDRMNESEKTSGSEKSKTTVAKEFIYSLNLDTTHIQDIGRYYLVEGDILLDKDKLTTYKGISEDSSGPKLKQARTTELVSTYKVHRITVRVDESIPTTLEDDWREAVQQAIHEWNITGSHVHLTYTTESTADITIRSDVDSDTGLLDNLTLAASEIPSNNCAGNEIRVNLDANNNYILSTGQKKFAIVHELGHCLGLEHTNWYTIDQWWNFNHIPIDIIGTPTAGTNPDPASVMNGGTAFVSWEAMQFSCSDIFAIRSLYPFIPISLNGNTNITFFKSWDTFTYYVDFGSSDPCSCSWSVSYSTGGGDELIGSGGSIVLVPQYLSSIKNGINEVNYLKVFCSGANQEVTIPINVKDGYRLYNSTYVVGGPPL